MLSVSDMVTQSTRLIELDDRARPAWTLTSSGDFTISSAWDALRPKRACLGSRKCVWNASAPCKIAVFMWKLLNRYLPFPDALQRFGLQLPSKCSFCLNGESQDHVFSECVLASQVWSFFRQGHVGSSVAYGRHYLPFTAMVAMSSSRLCTG
nr:uncharacterized protein LOC113709975 [Coffea arabica]